MQASETKFSFFFFHLTILLLQQQLQQQVWSLETWECERILEHHTNSVRALVVMCRKLISGAVDGQIVMWNMDTWKPERILAQVREILH
jgi:WD40 repeat protein